MREAYGLAHRMSDEEVAAETEKDWRFLVESVLFDVCIFAIYLCFSFIV